ncbi:hypothetical protein SALBM135S_09452 [Streptomyces alboniger]
MVIAAPAETPSSASPSVPADAPVCSLMAGMRTTHPAKMKPSSAKKTVSTIRRRRRSVTVGRDAAVPSLFSSGTK